MSMRGKHLRWEPSSAGFFHLWIDVAERKLIVLCTELFHELQAVIDHANALTVKPPIVLRSAKPRGFVVGADLREILSVGCDAEIQHFLGLGQRVFDAWEQLSNPTIAWIHGPCLGGGLELALACRYRLLSDSPETVLGMPESRLGLTPGWGGTQRLPRLIGVPASLPLLIYGESINGEQACQIGLADGIASSVATDPEIASWIAKIQATSQDAPAQAEKSARSFDRSDLKRDWLACEPIYRKALDEANSETEPYVVNARRAILKAVDAGIEHSMAEGLRHERENFYALLIRPEVQANLQRFAHRGATTAPNTTEKPHNT